jgi:hypothetical protein
MPSLTAAAFAALALLAGQAPPPAPAPAQPATLADAVRDAETDFARALGATRAIRQDAIKQLQALPTWQNCLTGGHCKKGCCNDPRVGRIDDFLPVRKTTYTSHNLCTSTGRLTEFGPPPIERKPLPK